MKPLRLIARYWGSHGTRILGFLATVCAGLPLIEGLVPPTHRPYWNGVNLALGALTIQRGTTNSRNTAKPPQGG